MIIKHAGSVFRYSDYMNQSSWLSSRDIFKSLHHDAADSVVCVYFQYCFNCLVHLFCKKTPQQMLQNVKSKGLGGHRPCKMILAEGSLFSVTSILAIWQVVPSCWMQLFLSWSLSSEQNCIIVNSDTLHRSVSEISDTVFSVRIWF